MPNDNTNVKNDEILEQSTAATEQNSDFVNESFLEKENSFSFLYQL